jgi:hydroxymethylpyrimidine pyrophosphatase-like HAD family hydrolase
MRFRVIATDFDGTLADRAYVTPQAWSLMRAVRASGRAIVLVTGRLLPDILSLLDEPRTFDRVVAENGAVVYNPVTGIERTLAEPAPPEFVAALHAKGVTPLEVGRVIVATTEPHEQTVLETIRELGLEWHIIFNKGAVMALPAIVTKAAGLADVLRELGQSRECTVAIGDGENDGAMLSLAGCGVAVANAVPALKAEADIVTSGERTAGVVEILQALLADDLSQRLTRMGTS